MLGLRFGLNCYINIGVHTPHSPVIKMTGLGSSLRNESRAAFLLKNGWKHGLGSMKVIARIRESRTLTSVAYIHTC